MSLFSYWDDVNLTAPQINRQINRPTFDTRGYLGDVNTAMGAQAGARGQQQTLADMLMARARGEGQSIAELQLQRTLEQNQKAAAGALAGVRGMNPALAQRLLLNQRAEMSQQAAGQGALLRAQEQQQAQALLGQQLGIQRGQDLGLYGSAGQLGQAQNALGVQADLQSQQQQLQQDMANQQAQQRAQAMEMAAKQEAERQRAELLGGVVDTVGTGIMAAATGGASLGPSMAGKLMGGAGGSGYTKGNLSQDIADYFNKGGMVKGKAPLYGNTPMNQKVDARMDHPKNDTVPAMLSPGEAVIPRSIMAAEDAPDKARVFIEALMKKKSPVEARKEAEKASPKSSLSKIKELEKRIKALEGK